jgi:hypothetical protein
MAVRGGVYASNINILAYCHLRSHAFTARIPRVAPGFVLDGPETSNEARWPRDKIC